VTIHASAMLKLALARIWLRISAIHPTYCVVCSYDQHRPLGSNADYLDAERMG
jgi:hypothetical protein